MPRNLIVVVADTLRHPQYLRGAPGGATMPFLDSLLPSGRSFPQLVSTSSWTCPAHAGLLSGADPWETHFFLSGTIRSVPSLPSVADRWREAGGESVAFSSNFLVAPEMGTAPGYDRFNPGLPARFAGTLQKAVTFLGYEQLVYLAAKASRVVGPHPGALGRAALGFGGSFYKSVNSMRSGRFIVRAIRRYLKARSGAARPLHLFVNLAETHEPYLVGQNGGLSGSTIDAGNLPSINFARHNDYLGPQGRDPRFLRAYSDSVRELDATLAELVDGLRRAGALRDAVLLFVSDHGQSLGEEGFFGHGHYLYDELVKIPGAIWEFRDGQPVTPSPAPPEWVDLRHVHDLLLSTIESTGPLDPSASLGASLARRGPAAAFWEGPKPRAPQGLLFRPPRSEVYRSVRLFQGTGTALLTSGLDGKEITSLPTTGPESTSEELADRGRRILGGVNLPAPETGPGSLDLEVDRRLRSWGYD